MNKKIYLLLIPVTLVAGFYLWPQKTTTEVSTEILTPPVSQNKKLFLGKRTQLHPVKGTVSLSESCRDLSNRLSSMDLNLPLKEMMKSFSVDEFKNCTEPSALERLTTLQKHCFEKFEQHECEANLLFVRAILRTFNVNDGYDLETMADLVLREFAKKVPDFKKLVELSDQLLQMNPSNAAFQKMWAMSKLISQDDMRNLPRGFAEEVYGRLDPDVLNDPELRGYRLFIETQLEPIKTEVFARNYVNEHPESPESYEILGWSLWQQNRRGEALVSLEKAMELNPKDQWLRDMHARLKAPGAKPEDYQGRLNLGIRLNDIMQ